MGTRLFQPLVESFSIIDAASFGSSRHAILHNDSQRGLRDITHQRKPAVEALLDEVNLNSSPER